MLAGVFGMVRQGFALGLLGNLKAAWHVLRANQVWAPYPENNPEAARQHMARFYRMANKAGRVSVDPRTAAELEVAWWQAHRMHQHDHRVTEADLLTSLIRLYSYVYQAKPDEVRRAAELRVQAMAHSDAGLSPDAISKTPPCAGAAGTGRFLHGIARSQRSSWAARIGSSERWRSEAIHRLALAGYATRATSVSLVGGYRRRFG
jgi:hypothetical protein